MPRRYDDRSHSRVFHDTPEAFYKQIYFEALDLIVNCIEDRFNQPGFRIYQRIESLLVKACKQEELKSDIEVVCKTYKDDFDKDLLFTQLKILGANFASSKESSITIFDIKDYLLTLSPGQLHK